MKGDEIAAFFDMMKKEVTNGSLPLGYKQVKQVKRQKLTNKIAKCNFYNTNCYLVGSFYKPVSLISVNSK